MKPAHYGQLVEYPAPERYRSTEDAEIRTEGSVTCRETVHPERHA
jgi:hypothetical protein